MPRPRRVHPYLPKQSVTIEAAAFELLLTATRSEIAVAFNYVIIQGRVFLARSEERLRGCCICPGLRLIHAIELKNDDARSR